MSGPPAVDALGILLTSLPEHGVEGAEDGDGTAQRNEARRGKTSMMPRARSRIFII